MSNILRNKKKGENQKFAKKVSIIIVAFNSDKYVKFCIESIKKQSYRNWELLIVNDCSTDNTKNIISKYKSKNIKIFNLIKNVGPYKATDFALKNAKGEYIAILDSDDYSHRLRIQSQVLELDNDNTIGLVFTKYKLVNYKNKILKSNKNQQFISEDDFNKKFPCINLACNSSAMFRREYIKKIKFYSKKYFYSNDYNFYLNIFKISKVKLINKFYTYYRVHLNQRTNVLDSKIILRECLSNLLWSLKNDLINYSNVIFFLSRFLITYSKLIFFNIKETLEIKIKY
jgi:glycosyltransferase involved in cell wall biosynthesis